MESTILQKLFKDGILVDVNVSFWSAAKTLTPEDLGLKQSDVADAYKLGHKYLIPPEVIGKFRTVEGKARRTVESNSFHFPIGNARFIPKKKFVKVLEELQTYVQEYDKLTTELIENYEAYKLKMVPVYQEAAETAYLKSQPATKEFNIEAEEAQKKEFINKFLMRIQSFYPPVTSLKDKFSLGWDVFEVSMPEFSQGDSDKIAQDQEKLALAKQLYQEQVKQKVSGFVSEVVTSMRSQTLELCSKISKNLKEGKVIQGRTINSLREFIDNFKELNFVGDVSMEAQLETFKKNFLDIHDTETINQSVDLKEELGRCLGELVEKASDISDINNITGEYKRKVEWQ